VTAWELPPLGWTCPECGFTFDPTAGPDLVDAYARFGRRYRTPLTRGLPGEDLIVLLRERPAPDTWSALECACHVRDALLVTEHRIGRALTEDRPQFRPVDPDAGASAGSYNEQDPATVADEIEAVAQRLADQVGAVDEDDWSRAGIRNGEDLTVRWLALNGAHEGSHHLLDIGRALRRARGR
jgi:S-DNA-T family DNA segregation ATPase FtsK/SpoIIIE